MASQNGERAKGREKWLGEFACQGEGEILVFGCADHEVIMVNCGMIKTCSV